MLLDITSFIRVFFFTAGSFALAMVLTPIISGYLYRNKLWKQPRQNAISGEKAVVYSALHKNKHRLIPTMAGVLIWGTVAIVTILFNLDRAGTYLPLFTLLTFGVLGLIDDSINTKSTNGVAGMSFATKLLSIIILSALGAWWFYFKLDWSVIHIPGGSFFGLPFTVDIGAWYIPLFILVVVASANAVNITDGLDGLAGGLLTSVFGAYTFIALAQGKEPLALFSATVMGATLAYTWFNIFPARFFMGDTGSMALGATLGVMAMLTNTALVLPIIGIVFVVETLSVILQLFWKKMFKRKLFPISPLHHTLEYIGWPETKVTMRLWVIGAIFAVVGLVLALIGLQ